MSEAGETSEFGQKMMNGANVGRTGSSELRHLNASSATLQLHTVESTGKRLLANRFQYCHV